MWVGEVFYGRNVKYKGTGGRFLVSLRSSEKASVADME
jgi:hypothetical protein